MQKVIIREWNDANMAGFEWSWQIWVSRRKDGTFSVGAKQITLDPPAQRIPARSRLRTGTEVLDAIQEIVEETSYSFDLDPELTEKIAANIECLSPELSKQFCDAAAATGYPKILATRESSTMASTWNEHLRLTKNEDGTASLHVCQYDVLGEYSEYCSADEAGNTPPLPDEIDGWPVVGVEDGYIVGGQLSPSEEEELTYSAKDVDDAIQWVVSEGFDLTEKLIEELRKAVA
jgi:hypothetical protein